MAYPNCARNFLIMIAVLFIWSKNCTSQEITVTSDPASPIQPFVYPNVTLTCTVELSPAVDVPVTVNTVWTGPAGFMINTTALPVMGSTTIYTSTAMVSSFGRNQSGNYNCTATVSSTSPFLIGGSSCSGAKRITTGVYLSFNGSVLINDSTIAISIIQTMLNQVSLVCTSDKMPCCQDTPQYGEWYFPNGSKVKHKVDVAMAFHTSRDNFGNVYLFRTAHNVTTPSGKFCCEIEDATHTNQTLCINICNSTCVQITDGIATPTLGQRYSLSCSVTRAQVDTYQWSKDGTILTETGPDLTFQILTLSDSGLYTCAITVDSETYNSSVEVILQLPATISVNISSDPISPIWPIGSDVTLACTVDFSPAVDIAVSVSTVWTGPAGFMTTNSAQPVLGSNTTYTSTAMVSSFGNDQSGNYTCTATVSSNSTFYSNGIQSVTEGITSGYVQISDGEASPILGQNYTLTCGVAGVSVNITSYEWKKNSTIISIKKSLNFFILRRFDSGLYTCKVIVDLLPYTNSTNIVSKVPAPISVALTSDHASPIRPVGSDVTLLCTVELIFPENFTVTVETIWIGPAGFMTTNTAQPFNGSTTIYTNVVMVSSFRRAQSGNYTCKVYVTSSDMRLSASDLKSSTIRVTVGVYLSLNGVVIDPNSNVLITDIGTSHPHQLVCITDRRPCCSIQPNRTGEWTLPNSANVPIFNARPSQFYRDRGPNGEVNLYRVNDDVNTPTGRFCCRIPDAINTIHTVCINVVSIQITGSEDTPTVGQNYSLTCNILQATATSYQWRKTGDSNVLNRSSVLFFTPLRLSFAGQYTCTATVGAVMYSGIERLLLKIPTPLSVTISSHPSGVVSVGANIILTCTVEVLSSVEIDVPVTVNVLLTDPNGSSVNTSDSSVSGSIHNSTAMITSLERDQSGFYTCTAQYNSTSNVFLIDSDSKSSKIRITVDTERLFQLRLTRVTDCLTWVDKDALRKIEDIVMAIAMNMEQRCQCGFTPTQITNSAFQCFPESPQAVTYRAVLHGTASASSSEITLYIKQWVTNGVTISIQNVLFNVDTNCVIEIDSNRDEECGVTEESTVTTITDVTTGSSSLISSIVGGTVSVVLISTLVIAIITTTFLLFNWRKKNQRKPNLSDSKEQNELKQFEKVEQSTAMDVECDTATSASITAEPEYAVIDDSIQSTGNYDYEKCPAYKYNFIS